MKNSPIKKIQSREYGQSPYSSIIHKRSPPKKPEHHFNSSQEDYWRNRSRSLENEVHALNEEILFQARKIDRIDELEEKIEVLLAQNSHLVDENESLIGLVQQKKAEADSWKARFEGEHTHYNAAEAEKQKVFDHLNLRDQEHQVQMDRMLSEISRLQDELQAVETLKQVELSQLRNKFENEAMNQIQNLKRSQYGNTELQELNIRKLKDELEERDFQTENIKREGKLEVERLNGEINYLKNEVKKVEAQKAHELELVRTESENTKNNLSRANKKNEEELRNLHEAKVKRMSYELEQKRAEIEDLHGKVKRGGKENESELSNMVGEKTKLRVELKENDNRNRVRISELTTFYEKQLTELRANAEEKERSMIAYYQTDIDSLKAVVAAKQTEIQRLIELNNELKKNEEIRLRDIRHNNSELREKMEKIIKHYEREIELMKIKVSQLYEADLESLRAHLRNSVSTHNREVENLRTMLDEVRHKLAEAVQQKIDLRVDYENRLNSFKALHERDVAQMRDLITMHEKQSDNMGSKNTLTHISHNNQVQQHTLDVKKINEERRNLEKQIENKNKQIESLNFTIQKIKGHHERDVSKLEEEVVKLKDQHQIWVERQTKENEDWNEERSALKERAHGLDLKMKRQSDAFEEEREKLKKTIEGRNERIAELEGSIMELNSQIGVLGGDMRVAAEGAEKSRLEHETQLNTEKDRYSEAKDTDRSLRNKEYERVQGKLNKVIEELKRENDILRDHEHQWKIRESDLKAEIGNLLDSLNKRSQMEESVINIGLSNNYFKNVAEIFKKQITD